MRGMWEAKDLLLQCLSSLPQFLLCHTLLLQFVLQDADMLLIFLFLLIDRILEFAGVLLYPAVSFHCSDRGSQRSVLSEQ